MKLHGHNLNLNTITGIFRRTNPAITIDIVDYQAHQRISKHVCLSAGAVELQPQTLPITTDEGEEFNIEFWQCPSCGAVRINKDSF